MLDLVNIGAIVHKPGYTVYICRLRMSTGHADPRLRTGNDPE